MRHLVRFWGYLCILSCFELKYKPQPFQLAGEWQQQRRSDDVEDRVAEGDAHRPHGQIHEGVVEEWQQGVGISTGTGSRRQLQAQSRKCKSYLSPQSLFIVSSPFSMATPPELP